MSDKELNLLIDETAQVSPSAKFEGVGTVVIGEYSIIEDNVLLSLGTNSSAKIEIGLRSKIKLGSILRCYDGVIRIGNRSSIGEYCVLTGHGGLYLGDAVIVAGHCYFTAAEHLMSSDIEIRFQGETAAGIRLEDNVWVGAHCTITDSVNIGQGSIIGAGSVVTRSLPPNYVCLGSPCRPLRPREKNWK